MDLLQLRPKLVEAAGESGASELAWELGILLCQVDAEMSSELSRVVLENTIDDIARVFKQSNGWVEGWIQTYKDLPPAERAAMRAWLSNGAPDVPAQRITPATDTVVA